MGKKLFLNIFVFVYNDKIVLDVGTGDGFPAIPLKLYNENLKITMLDSLNKRIKFLNSNLRLRYLKT